MKNKKWLSIAVAFFASVALWFYVVTIENPVKETTIHNVPVVFNNQQILREDYDLLIVDSNVVSGVDLTFSGRISDLNKLQMHKSNLKVEIDISHLYNTQMKNTQDHSLSFDIGDISFPSTLSSKDVTLMSKRPEGVNITIEKIAKKTIKVEVDRENVKLREGFIEGEFTQSFQEITIEGPQRVVDQIDHAHATLSRENVDQSISETLDLIMVDKEGRVINNETVEATATQIEVNLAVLMVKEVPLDIGLIDGGGATKDDAVYEISPKTIKLSGEAASLDAVQSLKLDNISLADLMSNNEVITRTIIIPEKCNNLSGETEAEIRIQIKNKAIRTINISSTHFQDMNLPEGYRLEFNTTSLPVTIRANEADIGQITEDNIRVVLDFAQSNFEAGKNKNVLAKFYIDGYEGAGVVGTQYYINVDIMPAG